MSVSSFIGAAMGEGCGGAGPYSRASLAPGPLAPRFGGTHRVAPPGSAPVGTPLEGFVPSAPAPPVPPAPAGSCHDRNHAVTAGVALTSGLRQRSRRPSRKSPVLIKSAPDLRDRDVPDKALYLRRREFIAAGAGAAATLGLGLGLQ